MANPMAAVDLAMRGDGRNTAVGTRFNAWMSPLFVSSRRTRRATPEIGGFSAGKRIDGTTGLGHNLLNMWTGSRCEVGLGSTIASATDAVKPLSGCTRRRGRGCRRCRMSPRCPAARSMPGGRNGRGGSRVRNAGQWNHPRGRPVFPFWGGEPMHLRAESASRAVSDSASPSQRETAASGSGTPVGQRSLGACSWRIDEMRATAWDVVARAALALVVLCLSPPPAHPDVTGLVETTWDDPDCVLATSDVLLSPYCCRCIPAAPSVTVAFCVITQSFGLK